MSNRADAAGSNPAAEIKVDEWKPAHPAEDARQADPDDALDRLQRFLESWTPSNPPRKVLALSPPRNFAASNPRLEVAAHVGLTGDAGQPLAGAMVEPPAPGLATALAQLGPRRRLLTATLLAAAAVGAFIVLYGALGLMKRPPFIASASHPAAVRPTAEPIDAASGKAFLLVPKEDAGASAKDANSEKPATPTAPASSDTAPAVGATPVRDARGGPAEAAKPQAPSLASHRMESSGTTAAPIPTPSSAPRAPQPAGEAVKTLAGPEPNAAGEPAVGMRSPESEAPSPRPANPAGVGEPATQKAVAAEATPLPPVRRASRVKPARRERNSKPHKAAQAEPAPKPSPPPAEPEARSPQPAGNPLLRALGNAFK